MLIFKKLVTKEWYKFFISSAFILFLLITVANLISGFLRKNVTAMEVIINHLLELPTSINRIFPISCLIASLFCINKLKNRNELTAIFALGYSRKNFIVDVLQAASVIALLQFISASYFSPFMKKQRHMLIRNSEHKFRNLRSKGLKSSTIGSGKIWYKSSNYYFAFSTFDKKRNILSDVSLIYLDENYLIKERVTAELVQRDDQSGLWLFKNGTHYTDLNTKIFPAIEKFDKRTFEINEKPEDFRQIEADITILDIKELYYYIKKLTNAGINTSEYQVMFLNKFSMSLICIIFALMATVAIFNPNRRSSSFGRSLGFVFIFTILYWLIQSYFLELGISSKIPPVIACFGVPLLFSLYLGIYFFKNRKLNRQ